VHDMLGRGLRTDNPRINNAMAGLSMLKNLSFSEKDRYLGCGEQRNWMLKLMRDQKYDAFWDFRPKAAIVFDRGLPTWHQWAEAYSGDPSDPVVHIDPWLGEVSTKSPE